MTQSKGTATISIEEYDRLRDIEKKIISILPQIEIGDKLILAAQSARDGQVYNFKERYGSLLLDIRVAFTKQN